MDYYLANRSGAFTQNPSPTYSNSIRQLRRGNASKLMLERLQKRMSFALENQLKRAGQQQQRLPRQLVQQNPQSRTKIPRKTPQFSNWNIV